MALWIWFRIVLWIIFNCSSHSQVWAAIWLKSLQADRFYNSKIPSSRQYCKQNEGSPDLVLSLDIFYPALCRAQEYSVGLEISYFCVHFWQTTCHLFWHISSLPQVLLLLHLLLVIPMSLTVVVSRNTLIPYFLNLAQIWKPLTVLNSTLQEDFETPPTSLNWWSFSWVI